MKAEGKNIIVNERKKNINKNYTFYNYIYVYVLQNINEIFN